MSEKIMIEARGLKLTYDAPNGDKVGVGTSPDGLSFEVRKGEIFGIIGPDGAGKSTLFRLLASLLLPQEGSAMVDGEDIISDYKALRHKIGYMPGNFSLYTDLTVEENLTFFATIFETTIEENYHLIKDIYQQIEPFKKRKAGALSGGMKQKLALSCALIHAPTVLYLDEPTTGIDPVSRVDLWNMLHKLSEMGVTIVVSTPYMDEAKQCHRIAFMQQGQFVAVGKPERLIEEYPYPIYEVSLVPEALRERLQLLNHLNTLAGKVCSFAFGDTFHLTTQSGVALEDIERHIAADSVLGGVVSVRPITPTLEDAFLLLSM